MAVTLFKEVSYNLAKLIQDIEMGEIGLPEIQRPFVWPNSKVRDLFDSMYKGFPVGYLLFWTNGIGDGHRQIGANTKQKVPRLLIVDGQQRLTSLYAVMQGVPVVRDDYRQEQISIAFSPLTEKFEVTDAAVRKNPEFIPDISQIWSAHTDMFELAEEYLTRLRAARPVSAEETKAIRKAINNLDNLQTYPFTALELSSAATEEQVADVFVRINSKGTTLNQADFILTLMSVFWDEGRAGLERFCRQTRQPAISGASPFNYFIQPDPDQLLRVEVGLGFRRARLQHVYSILRGKDLETEQFSDDLRTKHFTILHEAQQYTLDLQNWHEFLKTLMRAGYRGASMITSQMALLYAYTFYLIGKRDYHVEAYTLRNTIARWFFMTALTGRYTGSPETVMEQDLARLRDVRDARGFVAVLDRIVDDTFTDDYWNITLPNELATSSPRSPSLFAYNAALNLLGARALFSQIAVAELLDPALRAKKAAVERHHLFPKGYLAKLGITEIRDTNQIANYALVEWADNIDISDDSPAKYIPKYEARFTPEELARMRYWHALPEGWERLEYRVFLEERQGRMAKVIRDAFTLLSTGTKPSSELLTIELPDTPVSDDVPEPDSVNDVVDDADEGLEPRHIMRREFWQAFIQRAAGRIPLPTRLGRGINSYISVPTAEKKRLYWDYSIRMRDAGLDLCVYRQDAAENKRLYDHLYAQREEIEHAFGAPLEWDRNDHGHGCYVRYKQPGGGLLAREAWSEIQERMIEAMVRFQKALGPMIQKLPD